MSRNKSGMPKEKCGTAAGNKKVIMAGLSKRMKEMC